MSNRFLLATSSSSSAATTSSGRNAAAADQTHATDPFDPQNNHSVDTDFDSYWEEEARNPHRNRIRIGRQYQATVPPLLKAGEKDQRKLDELETLSFCPKKSARVSDTELNHYFTVAKSLNLFASLVETRSLLGRDVTIADLNHIRNKEGLSLASVIQPIRSSASTTSYGNYSANASPPSSQPQQSSTTSQSAQATHSNSSSNTTTTTTANSNTNKSSTSLSSSSLSPRDESASVDNFYYNQPLMKALSHFISLHHPCQHDRDCKKLLKDIPLEDDSGPAVSITSGNLRQGSSYCGSKEAKPGRSRSSLKNQLANVHQTQTKDEASVVTSENNQDDHQVSSGDNLQSPTYEDWTREEVELFSKAIEVCGKNFSSIKKEFLPSKSVRSIVEYYYIGSRDASESKKKSSQPAETASDVCSSPEKTLANNNGQGGGSGPSVGGKRGTNLTGSSNSTATTSSNRTPSSNDTNQQNKPLSDSNEETKQTSNLEDVQTHNKTMSTPKHLKQLDHTAYNSDMTNSGKTKAKNVDPRMSVYNFDEELKEDSPIQFDCPRPGAEVKPLRANPIIPNDSINSDATNSNVGSLKFFMDGQLVLKLNACQDQQEGIEKCHWVQSGDKVINASKNKRYTKRASDRSSDFNQTNGSQSNSVVSSFQDDDSKNDDLTGDEDSKESMSSFSNLPQQKNNIQRNNNTNHGSPTSKRLKIRSESNNSTLQQQHQQQQPGQLPSPINYNRLAVNNRIKDRNDTLNSNPVISQAMPWLQANSLAVAAALLSGLPFPPAPGNMIDDTAAQQTNINSINMASRPMDLSLEHTVPKAIQKSSSRSGRSKPKNN